MIGEWYPRPPACYCTLPSFYPGCCARCGVNPDSTNAATPAPDKSVGDLRVNITTNKAEILADLAEIEKAVDELVEKAKQLPNITFPPARDGKVTITLGDLGRGGQEFDPHEDPAIERIRSAMRVLLKTNLMNVSGDGATTTYADAPVTLTKE